MEFKDANELTAKIGTGNQGRGISAFIKEQLDSIPEGKGLALKQLAVALENEFNVPRQQGYVRINMVLKRKNYKHLLRAVDTDGFTYITASVAA